MKKNIFLKLILISTLSIIGTNLSAKELFIDVNYGHKNDIHNLDKVSTAKWWNPTSTALPKIKDYTPETSLGNPDYNLTVNTGTFNSLEELRKGACKDVYRVDNEFLANSFILSEIEKTNPSIYIDTMYQKAGMYNNKDIQNMNIKGFVPSVTIKSGSFNLEKGTINGGHNKTYTDINQLMRVSLALEINIIKGNKDLIEESETIVNLTNYQKIARSIKENFNIKNWSYEAFNSETGFYEYIANFKNLLTRIIESKEVSKSELETLMFIKDIVDLGTALNAKYFTNFSFPSYTSTWNPLLDDKKSVCMFDEDIEAQLDKINQQIKLDNNSEIVSFMRNYDFEQSIFNISQVVLNLDSVRKFKYNNKWAQWWWVWFRNYYNIGFTFTSTKMEVSKLYGIKIVDKNGIVSGSYMNKITFKDETTPQLDKEIVEGREAGTASTQPGNYKEWAESFDTINTDATTFTSSMTPEEVFEASIETPSSDSISNVCGNYYENNFANNIVYLDSSTMKFGNNQYLITPNSSVPLSDKVKNKSFMSEDVYSSMLSLIEKEHLTGTIYADVPNTIGNSSNGDFDFSSTEPHNVMYFYKKLVSNDNLPATCSNMFSASKMTKPVVIFKENNKNVFTRTGKFTNNRHLPFYTNQNVQPLNSVSISDMEDGASRLNDGNPIGEIEKVLDLANYNGEEVNGIMYNNKNLQLPISFKNEEVNWKADYSIVSTYFPIWYPRDTNDFNKYGPVGPFFNQEEYVIKEKYSGCDGKDWEGSREIPNTVECVVIACSKSEMVDKSSTDENNVTTEWKEEECKETREYKGTFATINGDSCVCNAPVPNIMNNIAVRNSMAIESNKRLVQNKYCVYKMENMVAKIKKRKMYYEQNEIDGKLTVQGFDPTKGEDGDASSVWGNMEDLRGTIYPSEIGVAKRYSNPISVISWEVNPRSSDVWSNPRTILEDSSNPCPWGSSVVFNGETYDSSKIIDASTTLAQFDTNTDLQKGAAIARTLMTTNLTEELPIELCDETVGSNCDSAVFDRLSTTEWSGLGINSGNMTTLYHGYLNTLNPLSFGSKIVLKNNNVKKGVAVRTSQYNSVFNQSSQWTFGEGTIFENKSNSTRSPEYRGRVMKFNNPDDFFTPIP